MFKDKIKALRRARGLTQKQLADIVGIGVSTVGKWEGKGNILPSDGVRERLADYFNVSIDYLMDRPQSENESDKYTARLISCFTQLNDEGRQLVLDYAEMISGKKQYKQDIRQSAI